jgi:hypothetical protein
MEQKEAGESKLADGRWPMAGIQGIGNLGLGICADNLKAL